MERLTWSRILAGGLFMGDLTEEFSKVEFLLMVSLGKGFDWWKGSLELGFDRWQCSNLLLSCFRCEKPRR